MVAEVAAAGVSAAASLAGSLLDYRQNKKAAEEAKLNRNELVAQIKKYQQMSGESLQPAYQAAQEGQMDAYGQGLSLSGQMFRPTLDFLQAGNIGAQEQIKAGLMGQRNAILGDNIDYGAVSPRNISIDYSALSGLTNPQGIQFGSIDRPETSFDAVENWSAGTSASYLSANPDVLEDFNQSTVALQEVDPQNFNFRTAENYAKWHYDNYGKKENRPLVPPSQGLQLSGLLSGVG